jgi:hypothetical protein
MYDVVPVKISCAGLPSNADSTTLCLTEPAPVATIMPEGSVRHAGSLYATVKALQPPGAVQVAATSICGRATVQGVG